MEFAKTPTILERSTRFYQRLGVYRALKSKERNSALDVFRSIAILAVVFYHFHRYVKLGYLGVDLFFVISGVLVGGILTREFMKNRPINIPRFLLQRGFKIWPSYYAFLILGSIFAFLMYRQSHPDQIIPWSQFAPYMFFYENYDPAVEHWGFGQVWSLCVEEHFYIILPLMFFLVQRLVAPKNRSAILGLTVLFTIFIGLMSKELTYYLSAAGSENLGTHSRIDALGWGVLLSLVIARYGERLKSLRYLWFLSLCGLVLFLGILAVEGKFSSRFYKEVLVHSVIPPCFVLIVLGAYYVDFSRFYPLRVIGYYSYNWYLWHMLFTGLISDKISSGRFGLGVYTATSFVVAVGATILIEEPLLRLRKQVVPALFG